jgi:hypothetical protein
MSQPVTLTFEYDTEKKQWRGSSEALPGFYTHGITLRTARHPLVRELRKARPGVPYVEAIKLPDPEATEHLAFQEARETHERLERELPAQRLQLAQRLIRLQIPIGDAARLLNLSAQHLALQLRAAAQATPSNSRVAE